MPEIDLGPLSTLTPLGVLSTTALIAAVDIVFALVASLVQTNPDGSRKFDLGFVDEWLISHGAKRVLPIYAFLALGVGIPAVDIPAVPALFSLAVAGVIGYAAETVASIRTNSQDATAIRDESSVTPA